MPPVFVSSAKGIRLQGVDGGGIEVQERRIRGMTREPGGGREDASRGDLADDEIWGPAKRRHALFSCCPFLFAGRVGKRHNNDSAKRRNRER